MAIGQVRKKVADINQKLVSIISEYCIPYHSVISLFPFTEQGKKWGTSFFSFLFLLSTQTTEATPFIKLKNHTAYFEMEIDVKLKCVFNLFAFVSEWQVV